jgi:hypothetical protein
MIDPMIERFVEHTIDSPIKLQLLLMYYENPRMEGTPSQIAQRIYRDIWSTREALRDLAEDGILSVSSMGGEPVYRYRPRPEHVEPIFRLAQVYNEPLERDQLQRILREVASYAPYRRAVQVGDAFERLVL